MAVKPHHALLLLLSFFPTSSALHLKSAAQGCTLEAYQPKCSDPAHTPTPCPPQGYIDYLLLFYCHLGRCPSLGYSLLALWLLVLFYLLGNTASVYFCSSLESLSRALSLPPTIAGVTLLSLGNGAPDVFATIVSFAGSGVGEVGLSSVLGGGFFVSSVVVGVISIAVGRRSVSIDRPSFVRDVCFLLLVLCVLLAILVVGSIGLLGAALFVCLYIAYVLAASASHCCRRKEGELRLPLLVGVELEDPLCIDKEEVGGADRSNWFTWLVYLLELPLYLPRRLTIPDVSVERWSKPFAVASVFCSPVLLATLWIAQRDEMGTEQGLTIYLFSGLIGVVLGVIAVETTESANPPKKFLLPWLAGGFTMSMVWAYIIAGELVSLLVSVGHILGISPSVLGVTVLAWGNSLGDLIANAAMALNGGEDGAQIAMSGCYAGPIFNTLVGLGLSLVLASWGSYPAPFVIPKDSSLYVTLGFLIGGLLWALVMLPRKGMRLDRVLGIGLLAIYLCFVCLRISESIGLLEVGGILHL